MRITHEDEYYFDHILCTFYISAIDRIQVNQSLQRLATRFSIRVSLTLLKIFTTLNIQIFAIVTRFSFLWQCSDLI